MSQGDDFMRTLLEQAQAMQQRLAEAQHDAAATIVEGSAGGGLVRVTMTGGLELQQVRVDPSAVDPDDVAMLEDLLTAAFRDAMAKAQALQTEAMGGAMGGLGGLGRSGGLPGLGGAPSGLGG